MKPRYAQGARTEARAALTLINAELGQDFHTLSAEQVDRILKLADHHRYRKPKNANGSRARYYYQLLQRRAR